MQKLKNAIYALNQTDKVMEHISEGTERILNAIQMVATNIVQLSNAVQHPGNAQLIPTMPDSTFPALQDVHVKNARIYANRRDMMKGFQEVRGGVIGEVGALLGTFSEVILDSLTPCEFVAFDLFDVHLHEGDWSKRHAASFHGLSHEEFYNNRFKGKNARTAKGDSSAKLREFPDHYFDLLYIDGAHTYEGVKADVDAALLKIKPNGILVFNDYIMYDWNVPTFYGIVPIVNRIIVEQGWEVIGFALEQFMFCDIAIRKRI